MRYVRLSIFVLALSISTTTSLRAQEYVDASKLFVQRLADRAVATAMADLPDDQVRSQIRDLLNDGFAVNGIARYVLGRYWRRATDEERTEYLQLFQEVVIHASANRLVNYTGQSFEITLAMATASANASEQAAIVRSRFHVSEGSTVRVDWRVASLGDNYKITDVILEGVSLANTYRDEYAAVVRRHGVEGLLSQLRAQRDELALITSEVTSAQ